MNNKVTILILFCFIILITLPVQADGWLLYQKKAISDLYIYQGMALRLSDLSYDNLNIILEPGISNLDNDLSHLFLNLGVYRKFDQSNYQMGLKYNYSQTKDIFSQNQLLLILRGENQINNFNVYSELAVSPIGNFKINNKSYRNTVGWSFILGTTFEIYPQVNLLLESTNGKLLLADKPTTTSTYNFGIQWQN